MSTILLLCLLLWLGKKVLRPGALVLTFTAWYGTMRVVTDFLRVDPEYDMGITGAMKIAHFCEALGLDVQLHASGPAHRHCIAAIRNTPQPTIAAAFGFGWPLLESGKAGPLLCLSVTVMPTQVSAVQITPSPEERPARGSRT